METNPNGLTERLGKLEAALARLESRICRLEDAAVADSWELRASEPRKPDVPLTSRPSPKVAAPSGPAASVAPKTRHTLVRVPQLSAELEVLIGTSWLNRLGIIAIIAAMAYFLKYAFDNQWIGPAGRIALTSLFGLVLLTAGERYQRHRLPVFAQGLSGGGLAVLYFAVFAAFEIYRLIGLLPAFVMMVLITVSAVLLAVRYNSATIALLGILAGFASPLLLGRDTGGGTAEPARPVSAGLYLYFLLLDAATYALAMRKGWLVFGGVGLAAGFLVPVVVGIAGTTNPSAALAYFLLLTLATLALSITYSVVKLAWAALAGGFLLSLASGAGRLLSTSPLISMAYFGVITVAATLVGARHNWGKVSVAATVAGTLLAIIIPFRPVIAVFLYLAVLASVALFASIRRNWVRADLIVFIATALAALSYLHGGEPLSLRFQQIGGVTLLFLVFSVTTTLASRDQTERRMLIVILAAAAFAGQLIRILGADQRDALALSAVGLALYHLIVARLLLRRGLPQLTILVFLGLAATFLTIVVPLKLHHEAIPLAWSVEGAALAWAAARTRNTWAGRAAAVVGILVAGRLILFETPAIATSRLLVSAPGLAFLVGILGLAVETWYLARLPWASEEEAYLAPTLGTLAGGLLLWWGGWEIDGAYQRIAVTFTQAASAKQATLSAWFTLYGFALVLGGFWKNAAPLRWAGIAMLGATALKVLFIDLAAAAVVFRIASLMVLGALLLLASLAYNRYRGRLTESSTRGREA